MLDNMSMLELMTGTKADGTPSDLPAAWPLSNISQVAHSQQTELVGTEGCSGVADHVLVGSDSGGSPEAEIDAVESLEQEASETAHGASQSLGFLKAVAAYIDNSNIQQGKPFAFTRPPPKAWWRWAFGISSAAADILVKVQWWAGRATATRGGKRHIANTAVWWQVQSGVTPKEWRAAKPALEAEGLLEFHVFHFAGKKATWVRPTNEFFAVFGVDQAIYDRVGSVIKRVKAGKPSAGSDAPSKILLTEEELTAISEWKSAGGWLPPLGANTKFGKPE